MPDNLANQLRALVVNSGETITAVARGAGIPVPVLWRFVRGKRLQLATSTVHKLMEYFNLELRQKDPGHR